MTPTIGIGFLSLIGIFLIAYVLFLVSQNRLQDELARHCREKEGKRRHASDTSLLTAVLKDYANERKSPQMATPQSNSSVRSLVILGAQRASLPAHLPN